MEGGWSDALGNVAAKVSLSNSLGRIRRCSPEEKRLEVLESRAIRGSLSLASVGTLGKGVIRLWVWREEHRTRLPGNRCLGGLLQRHRLHHAVGHWASPGRQ